MEDFTVNKVERYAYGLAGGFPKCLPGCAKCSDARGKVSFRKVNSRMFAHGMASPTAGRRWGKPDGALVRMQNAERDDRSRRPERGPLYDVWRENARMHPSEWRVFPSLAKP